MAGTGRGIGKKLTDILLETLWRSGGAYPAWGTDEAWDEVLEDKRLLSDCQMFHCLPSELDGEDYHLLARLRAIAAAESRYQAADSKARASRPKRRR